MRCLIAVELFLFLPSPTSQMILVSSRPELINSQRLVNKLGKQSSWHSQLQHSWHKIDKQKGTKHRMSFCYRNQCYKSLVSISTLVPLEKVFNAAGWTSTEVFYLWLNFKVWKWNLYSILYWRVNKMCFLVIHGLYSGEYFWAFSVFCSLCKNTESFKGRH